MLGPETDKNIYTRGFDTNNMEFINIYKNDNKLYIESVYRNKYTYFVGDISNVKLKKSIDQRVFANRMVKLEKYKEKENNNKTFKEIKNDKNSTKINIIEYAEWSEIILPILENVIITLVPKKKMRQLLFLWRIRIWLYSIMIKT